MFVDRAARAVHEAVPERSKDGLARLGQASLSRCINSRDRRKNRDLPCIQGGWGSVLGS